MTAELLINTPIQCETEQIDGRWRARQRALALTAYAATPEEASAKLLNALTLLVNVLMEQGGVASVTEYFDRAGVPLTTIEKNGPAQQTFPLTLTLTKSLEPA